jgi:gamma-glutamyl-gamma-aminobutyrate hydrolase PuuD
MGGGAILDNCIVKIRQANGGTLYQHAHYKAPKVEIMPHTEPKHEDLKEYNFTTFVNGKLHGLHKTKRNAVLCANKIK